MRQPCDETAILYSQSASSCRRDIEKWVLAATILGSTMAFVDGSVVNVALPVLQLALKATVSDLQWVVEASTLFLAALTLVGGTLGDRCGRRIVFTIGVVVFTLASAAYGLAPGAGQLIAARAVQGVGAALLVPGSLPIIGASFGNDRPGRAIGTWSGFTAISSALGPVVGGWLVEHISWRAVFFINLFPAMVTLGLGMAITVAPLTTTVMNAVDEDHVGAASGINNSVSRVAGLLAVAVFGIVVLSTFSSSLDQRLASLHMSPQVQLAIDAQRTRLAGIQVPANISAGTKSQIKLAVAKAYVDGYRLAMLVAAGLALASAGSAELLIGSRRAKTSAR